MSELHVTGGTIVTAEASFPGEVLVRDGKIAAVGTGLAASSSAETIDAEGLLVLPGGIDVHTHFDETFMGATCADDFTTGGSAALAGGITTHVDFAYQPRDGTLDDALEEWHAKANGKAVIDYGFHLVVTNLDDRTSADVPKKIAEGYPTYKVFMTYPELHLDDLQLFRLLQLTGRHGGRVSVHAENFYLSDELQRQLLSEGKTDPRWHAESRPWQSEHEAVTRAIALADSAGSSLYVVHMSAGPGVDELVAANRRGVPVIGETCIQYLALTEAVYDVDGPEPARYLCSPPLRSRDHQDRLWEGLRMGDISVVGSDHNPFDLEDRLRLGGDNFTTIPNGIGTIEQVRPLLWTLGVVAGRITAEQFVAVTATGPARHMGLTPTKGALAPGADADIVIWDPEKRVTLSRETTFSAAECLFEGFECMGYTHTTISRGEVVFRDHTVTAEAGRGRFVARHLRGSLRTG